MSYKISVRTASGGKGLIDPVQRKITDQVSASSTKVVDTYDLTDSSSGDYSLSLFNKTEGVVKKQIVTGKPDQ